MSLLALIVDDEPPARAELRFQLEAFPEVRVVGEAADAREARTLIDAVDYDAIFLDLEMPGVHGLDLAATLHDGRVAPPFVVVVTAHDEHALAAYQVAAVDYLLKPVTAARLAQTIDRLQALVEASRGAGQGSRSAAPPAGQAQRAPVRFLGGLDGNRTVPVAVDRIAFLRANGDVVELWQADGKQLTVRSTMQDLERVLPADMFVRCHRAYIVNLHQVAEIDRFFNGTYLLRMRGPGRVQVPVSRQNAPRIRDRFHL